MSQINCLRCKQPIDATYDQCPHCSEKVTQFQRTYSSRLLDGKYQIIDRLGIGGMGEIFKVRHIHLNELRVIKIMRPNVAADDQGLQRFLQEARTSTMIKHKNLAMLYDFAQLEDGSYYMVWEFIDGTNIQKWIAQNGAIPPRLAVEMAIQALHGLDHLHSMDLIHRDISPENIMLSQDTKGKLVVKVIDFGIAKQLAEGDGGQGLTQTGMFLGKLKYASPEQAGFLKEGEHLDPRSDLYSFGIVMYEMLAGRAPFQATNPHGYILKHVTEKPAPISELNPAAKVPAQLEALIMRSLEKNRDGRFATAADFAEALEGIRSSIPPDPKYGLGEKMITLSGAQTLADLPKMTGGGTSPSPTISGAQATQQTYAGQQATQQTYAGGAVPVNTLPGGRSAGPTGTRSANDEATVMERNLGVSPKTIGSNEATVMERLGGAAAAPTAVEQKWTGGSAEAEATVLERQMSPGDMAMPKTGSKRLLLAAAALFLVILAIGGYFLLQKKEPVTVPVATNTDPTATTTDAPVPATPRPRVLRPDEGLLLLSAQPWGDIQKIVSKDDQKEFPFSDDSTPASIPLPPGDYSITLRSRKGTKTVDVAVKAGTPTKIHAMLDQVNFHELTQEVTKP